MKVLVLNGSPKGNNSITLQTVLYLEKLNKKIEMGNISADQITPKFLETEKLDKWVHNKTIQKAIESFKITPQQKEYLRKLKMK